MSRITVPVHPDNLISANHRTHWADKAHRTRNVRLLGRYAARNLPAMHAAHLTVTVHPPDRRRRDLDNTMPTVKAIVDGIVDAKVLPDDNRNHLASLTLQPGDVETPGTWLFRIHLQEVS